MALPAEHYAREVVFVALKHIDDAAIAARIPDDMPADEARELAGEVSRLLAKARIDIRFPSGPYTGHPPKESQ
jgi:hypothetical protein